MKDVENIDDLLPLRYIYQDRGGRAKGEIRFFPFYR